jgi:hypothetical protein
MYLVVGVVVVNASDIEHSYNNNNVTLLVVRIVAPLLCTVIGVVLVVTFMIFVSLAHLFISNIRNTVNVVLQLFNQWQIESDNEVNAVIRNTFAKIAFSVFLCSYLKHYYLPFHTCVYILLFCLFYREIFFI